MAGRVDGFYLTGGTALSLIYFQHRESYDIDLFTKEFSGKRILDVVDYLNKEPGVSIKFVAEQTNDKMAKAAVYTMVFEDQTVGKIDFVEDFVEILKPLRMVDGIPVLSIEDIYLRKIYTMAGSLKSLNNLGAEVMIGGRQEAKDFYDLYCLSHTSMRLSEFVKQYGHPVMKEGIVQWFSTFDRMHIKTGLLDLIVAQEIDYRPMEAHFKKEVDKIILDMIEEK